MSLVQIKGLYNYYSTKRVTPVYILHEELENFSFEEFKSRMKNTYARRPHCAGLSRTTTWKSICHLPTSTFKSEIFYKKETL